MKRTSKYNLTWFEEGDFTSGILDMQRWETVDSQLYALYQIMGNGIIQGWGLTSGGGLTLTINPGKGNVSFVAAETIQAGTLVLTSNSRNYIYAVLTPETYWTKKIGFSAYLSQQFLIEGTYLGYVDTSLNSIIKIDTSGIQQLSFVGLISNIVKTHRHIGGSINPQPVNLAKEVQGILNVNNLPDLDATMVTSGVFDSARIPILDHKSKLSGVGNLTHAQLDSVVQQAILTNQTLMGETSTVNLLQLILAIKHIYPDIDKYLMNEIAFIPGISPDSHIDTENSTAIIDTTIASEGGGHTISGASNVASTLRVKAWQSREDFLDASSSNNMYITGDSATLEVVENVLTLDDFSDISSWNIALQNLGSVPATFSQDSSTYVIPPNSGKLSVGSENIEIVLLAQKIFTGMNWSGYKYLRFYIYTSSVQHGDLFFYFNDSHSGAQNSYIKILDRNTPTINQDTLLNGWQEITIDISKYSRTSINQIGIYVSTQYGWDTSKGFDLNIDDIVLTSGNLYQSNGYLRFIYGNDFPYAFYRLRWDAFTPTDTESTGCILQVRSRYSNTVEGLSLAAWSTYSSISGTLINLPSSNLYKYLEIEVNLTASVALTRSPILYALYLDYNVSDVYDTIEFNKKQDWESGELYNIDLNTVTNSLSISSTEDIGTYIYGSNGNANILNSDLDSLYKIYGTSLPYSTNQAMNGLPPGLGTISGVSRGNNGNVWVTDTDNDRVLELDKAGRLVTGFYGSFLTEPLDTYGIEDAGPGSNYNVLTTTTTTISQESLTLLNSIYNDTSGVLYAIFNQNLEYIYTDVNRFFKPERFYVKIANQKIYLNTSTIDLVGIDPYKYALWKKGDISQGQGNELTNQIIQGLNQFDFSSHILKFTLTDANKALLNYLLGNTNPSIVISSLMPNQFTESDITINFPTSNYNLDTKNIRVTVDGSSTITTQENISLSGLSNGNHTIEVQLLDEYFNPYSNIESNVQSNFIVSSFESNPPHIYIESPRANQIFSAGVAQINFVVENFAVVPGGQHLRYVVDGNTPIDCYSSNLVTINNLNQGKHYFTIYMVDQNGNTLSYPYSSASVEFIVGSSYSLTLYVEPNAIYNEDLSKSNSQTKSYVGVGNITICNIFSPIDIQVIPFDASFSGSSVLISKLRSPSWTNGLSNVEYYNELKNRLIASLDDSANLTQSFPDILSHLLIYSTYYLDGHSVVQLDMNGQVVFSNNAAKFATSKEEAKRILGSAEKNTSNELFIGDSYNKRAIITYTDPITNLPAILWQYDSDKYIGDFHLVPRTDVTISITDGNIDLSSLYAIIGTTITWINNSSSPIAIYSGYTSSDIFTANPDLNLYGLTFKSDTLQPGETYQYQFNTVGVWDWFTYPGILTAKINISTRRLSADDQYLILENDGLNSPFSSRIIKVDSWGNILWSFGEGYLVNPKDARPLMDNSILIST